MNNIDLSYIIATRNRLPYLRIVFKKLLSDLKENEEIVVVDGNSTDGSKEFLQQLFDKGQIHHFISEPDKNQAHAWNKALMMAQGTIIKKVIDDDVHDFTAIRKCKDFMLLNNDVDICISNCLGSALVNPAKIELASRLPYFLKWKNGATNTFTFSDVYMLVRRSALSYLGLYDIQFKMIDWEYSLRASYLQAKIAYYTGYNSLTVATPGNVTSTATRQLFKLEEKIGQAKYGYPGDGAEISYYSRLKICVGKLRYKLLNQSKPSSDMMEMPSEYQLEAIYAVFYKRLSEQNAGEFDFIH